MIARRRIVVVGASQAGYTAAVALRNLGFDGAITLLGDEPHQPYARPPLSKGVLLGSEPDDSVFLPPTDGIELLTSVKAVRLDRDKSRVQLDDGDTIAYDGLVIATGARARRLSGRSTEITVRTLDDAVLLRRSLADVSDIAIVGAGFLGLEIASSAADLGKKATVIDQVTPLVGRLGPLLSDMCLTAAADKGVKVRVSRDGVEISDHAPGRLQAANGAVLAEADLVVTAVGDIPNTEWLDDSGLMLAHGVVVDPRCQVAPGIVAAGDVITLTGPDGRRARSPHWWNALAQAKIAAATLLGRTPGAPRGGAVPFFWTDIFGLRIRLAGKLPPVGQPTVIDGSIADRRMLLTWPAANPEDAFGTAAAVNYPISAPKLTKLALPGASLSARQEPHAHGI